MAKYSSICEFNIDKENWISYFERLIHYFVANTVAEEGNTRNATMFNSCGAPNYQLIRNMVAPGKPR